MTQKKKYVQLTYEHRRLISHWKARGLGVSEIARHVNVDKSTISRELRRNGQPITREEQLFWKEISLAGHPPEQVRKFLTELAPTLVEKNDWTALEAQRKRVGRLNAAQSLRRRKKPETCKWVIEKLNEHWSPEQIAGRSKLDGPEKVSYEFVYRLIYKNRKNGGTLYQLLKRFGRRKQRFGARQYPDGPIIPNRTGIEKRPAFIEKRTRLGDLEGDLIQGFRSTG